MKTKQHKRKGRGMQKGSSFEREICKQLSLWWTDGERDDVFWRTSGSGARAKTRAKTGGRTFGQYGDVQATDPIGQPLLDLFSIEIKRGYSKATLSDFIDNRQKTKPQLQKFLEQATKDSQLRGDECSWILLVKRDYKNTMLFIPYTLFKTMTTHQNKPKTEMGCMLLKCKMLDEKRIILICTLDWFWERITPKDILDEHTIWEDSHTL